MAAPDADRDATVTFGAECDCSVMFEAATKLAPC